MAPFQHHLIYSGQRSDQSYYFSTSGCHIFTLCNSSAIFFFWLCFLFINILLVFSPMDPRKHKVLYILAARRHQQHRIVRYLFIFLSQNSKILKRTVSTKESANQRTSQFLWGWWPILPFLCGRLSYFFFLPPNYILSVDNFAQFEVGCRKLARTGGTKTGRGGRKSLTMTRSCSWGY